MDNTDRSKLNWSRISYVVISVILASTILASFLEHDAYAKGKPYSREYTFGQAVVLFFMPMVVLAGLGLIAAIARRSLSVTVDN